MKMTSILLLGTVAILATAPNLRATDFSPSDTANRAVAASPRALEVFPWLARDTAKPAVAAKPSDSGAALTALTRNRAFAASPRALEQFPELGRPVQPLHKSAESSVASNVTKNRAVAASPRALEEFPWLARGAVTQTSKKSFEIAPVK